MRRGAETREEISQRFVVRSFWVFGIFVFLSFFLIVRATYLQVLNKDFLIEQGDKRQIRDIEIVAYRGTISDRNNKPLAISIPVDTISINPKSFNEDDIKLEQLSDLLGRDHEELIKLIKNSKSKSFLYIERKVPTDISDQIKLLNIAKLDFKREYKRSYPAGEIISQLLGLTNIDEKGTEGIELQYDASLSGIPGIKRILRDDHNRHIENIKIIKSPKPGADLTLSIDLRLQHIAHRALERAIIENKAYSGSVILVDAPRGEILAIANHPTYDNNERLSLNPELMRNRAIIDMYEPGSSIKPIILARAVDSGLYDVTSIIDTSPIKIGSKIIKDDRNHGDVDLATVLKKSSNPGMSRIGLSLESNALWEMMSDFGFGKYVTDGFPGESRGRLHHHTEWGEIGKATMSYGYGITVTPIQLAQAYSVIANDGIYTPLTLRKGLSQESERIVSKNTAKILHKMLEKVVEDGTSKKAAVNGYRVGGKTGTAWKTSGTGGYSTDRYRSIFAGIAPIDDPRLVAVVFIEEPTGKFHYGGDVAAPVFSEIISQSLQLLSIPPQGFITKSDLVADNKND
jgi:cell division protein FtsI (penicillin-binding protein 3)